LPISKRVSKIKAMKKISIATLIIASIFLFGCTQHSEEVELNTLTPGNMEITTPAFEHNGEIPSKYTCDAEDLNPELQISGVPESTDSLVLIVDDPDAPAKTWVHWVVFNIDPSTETIKENSAPSGAVEGTTDFGRTGWGGPCPPPPTGEHRYFFKLYALDTTLDLDSSATKTDVEQAMADHVLDSASLIGLYSRS